MASVRLTHEIRNDILNAALAFKLRKRIEKRNASQLPTVKSN